VKYPFRIVVGAVLILIAAAAGFVAQRKLSERTLHLDATGHADAAFVTRSREPANDGGGAKPGVDAPDGSETSARARAIPDRLPQFTLPDREGKSRSLSEWKGRPLVVNFWATWCAPCRHEIPLLRQLRHERTADRLEIIGVAIDQREDVLKYAREIGMDYPLLIGEKEGYAAAEAFGVSLVLPFSVFADREGQIVTLKIGELHRDEAEFILDRMREVDAEKLTLPAAREQIAAKMREFAVARAKQGAARTRMSEP
jgi:thiol-disulfide isomerase/thioredoxin